MERPAAPAAPSAPPAPSAASTAPKRTVIPSMPLEITSGAIASPERILLFGPGGVGKSSLAAWLPSPLFLDVEKGTRRFNVARDSNIPDWQTLRAKIASIVANPPQGIRSIVVDTLTEAEKKAGDFVVDTRKAGKSGNKAATSLEDYGWGKGFQFVSEEMEALLSDCDRLIDRGLHVCLIAHDVTAPVPNPAGEDFIRWEPRLYNGDKHGKGSVRAAVKGWADHVLFIGYDVFVSEDGKAQGSGSRSVYTAERPTHIAKSRAGDFVIPYTLEDPAATWRKLSILTD